MTLRMAETLSSGSTRALGPPMSVLTQPGWITTTVMPRGLRSTDRLFITAFTAALDER